MFTLRSPQGYWLMLATGKAARHQQSAGTWAGKGSMLGESVGVIR